MCAILVLLFFKVPLSFISFTAESSFFFWSLAVPIHNTPVQYVAALLRADSNLADEVNAE